MTCLQQIKLRCPVCDTVAEQAEQVGADNENFKAQEHILTVARRQAQEPEEWLQ